MAVLNRNQLREEAESAVLEIVSLHEKGIDMNALSKKIEAKQLPERFIREAIWKLVEEGRIYLNSQYKFMRKS